jgi:hypothetical protein
MKRVFRLWKTLGLVALALVVGTTGCQEDEGQPASRPGIIAGSLAVQVIHPSLGAGPGFLVSHYRSVQEFDRGIPTESRATDATGFSRFSRVTVGRAYVDCRVVLNDSISLYDSALVDIRINQETPLILRLDTLRTQP